MSKIDKYFKDQLDGSPMVPSPQVWERIQQAGVIGEEKKGMILPMFLKVAVAAMITVGAFTVAWLWINQDSAMEPLVAEELIENKPTPVYPISPDPVHTPEESKNNPSEKSSEDSTKNEEKIKKEKSNSNHPDNKTNISPRANIKNRKPSAIEKAESNQDRPVFASLELLPSTIQSSFEIQSKDVKYVSFSKGLSFASNPPAIIQVSEKDENAWMYAQSEADKRQDNDDTTITEKLFQFAEEKLSTFADASGLPFRKLSKVSEIEIIY